MPLTGSFHFVRIPASDDEPIELLAADKSGGLEHDALIKHAKLAFHELQSSLSQTVIQHLEHDGPARQALVARVRQRVHQEKAAAPIHKQCVDSMDDDALLQALREKHALLAQEMSSGCDCDITALTVPTAGNGYQAVSMYAYNNAREYHLPQNARATAVLTACGHCHAAAGDAVVGDVFVGRAHDDEEKDVWERMEFTVGDVDPTADWCRVARSPGGGGGSGTAAAASLSRLVQQQQGAGGLQVIDGRSGGGGDNAVSLFGLNGAPAVQTSWGSWTQTNDEVELKFGVASGTKAKYCKISFGRTSLKVAVAGQTLLQGTTFDPIVPDECTFTLQDEGSTGRELCVTLIKKETGRTWAWAAQ